MTVTLRPATASDLPGLSGIEIAALGADAWSPDALRQEMAGVPESRTVLVAEVPGPASESADRIVGYGVLREVQRVADVQRLAVHPDWWRQGIGSLLLRTLLDDAVGRRCSEVLLEVADDNSAAIELYLAHGFGQIARRRAYYARGGDALVLRCPMNHGGPTVTACAT